MCPFKNYLAENAVAEALRQFGNQRKLTTWRRDALRSAGCLMSLEIPSQGSFPISQDPQTTPKREPV
jgi:hypothetical protein